jgi:hypothetical protein
MAANALTSHDDIQRWAEQHGARPACVKRTGGDGDVGIIRLDVSGYSGEDTLEEIDWSAWFDKFDRQHLALLVDEDGDSNFNKLVRRSEGSGRGIRFGAVPAGIAAAAAAAGDAEADEDDAAHDEDKDADDEDADLEDEDDDDDDFDEDDEDDDEDAADEDDVAKEEP